MSGYGAAPLGLGMTRDLAAFLASFPATILPPEVLHAGRRGVLDWLGCALAGSTHRTVGILLTVLREASPTGPCAVIGHAATMGLLEGPLANGQMGHVLDYDDTHMQGVVLHASSPVLAALFALAGRGKVSGEALLAAYAAGFEAGVRVGQTAPGHHKGGWHLTGTLGTIAAGAAAGRLLGLNATQMVHCLGTAATQAAGMQQNRGTMCKSFHAGKAAQGGLLAALLASQGFDSSDEIIEGKRGFCRIYSDTAEPELLLEGLGERWEITRNGHKPYACGVVLHPLIDAMIALGGEHRGRAADVEAVELTVNPAVVTITGVTDPGTGLKSKFSLTHSAAVAFLDGNAGIAQYGDARAAAPDVAALRRKVSVRTDPDLGRDQARASLTLAGTRYEAFTEHATGTVANPMSDAALEMKFMANAVPVIGEGQARALADATWTLDTLPDVGDLLALCVPCGRT
ncbi:MAG: MmgE/PrpD family protein [Janthinobacterium lividum]